MMKSQEHSLYGFSPLFFIQWALSAVLWIWWSSFSASFALSVSLSLSMLEMTVAPDRNAQIELLDAIEADVSILLLSC